MDEDELQTNEVTLRGRVSSEPQARALPSGDVVVTFRLVARRGRVSPMTRGSRQVSDWVDCAAWGGRVRGSAAAWQVGDEVEVRGALRRRFYRTPAGSATRLEVEVLAGKRLRRAEPGATQSGSAGAH
ncbi:MAG TPA: single-stranded DNA-binding protein [Marmoricola sp.]|nr:single-stranded DNA-binding protein [Marmoricola sp.]